MTVQEYQQIAHTIPKEPGVYRFLDSDERIIYVGKAKKLKNRLASYFQSIDKLTRKTRMMVQAAERFDYTVVNSEVDALLLENSLIKKFQPRYNILLKDGKSYPYICIKNERFPRVFTTRSLIKDGSTYFGPYTSGRQMKVILDLIKQLFPLRTCAHNLSKKNIDADKFDLCLEYHIKRCKGPCKGLETEESYLARIDQIKNILKGNFVDVKKHLHQEMNWYAERLDFEKAQALKDNLRAFEDYQSKSTVVSTTIKDVDVFGIAQEENLAFVSYLKIVNGAIINTFSVEIRKNFDESDESILSYTIPELRERFQSIAPEIIVPEEIFLADITILQTIPKIGDKKKLQELASQNAKYLLLQHKKLVASKSKKQTSAERILTTLKKDLQMQDMPLHIECFDNSNLQGSFPVSSCVVFKNAIPSKKDYRHFKIKTVEGPDDFASMTEVVFRRYKRLLDEQQPLPQLVIIDGGKGQLSAAMKSVYDLGLENRLVVIGIAKRLEEIYFPNDSIPLYINKKSESLKLIQQLRNEAHRFAITFHKDQRSKYFLVTELTDIPGIGLKTAQKLLKKFGSVAGIKTAEPKSLEAVAGPSLAAKIMQHFAKELDEPS